MQATVKNVTIWRKEVDNRPGELAAVLTPLAKAGASLKVLMGYRVPGQEGKAAIEVYPVSGTKASRAAAAAGLTKSSIPALYVEGADRPGLGGALAELPGHAGRGTEVLGGLGLRVAGGSAPCGGPHSEDQVARSNPSCDSRRVQRHGDASGARCGWRGSTFPKGFVIL